VWFTGAPKVLPGDRRAVLVELSLCAVLPRFHGKQPGGISIPGFTFPMRASGTCDLPCPWVPLQSMTAVASHRIPGRRQRGDPAEARSRAQKSLGCASGGRFTRPKECGPSARGQVEQAPRGLEPGLPEVRRALRRDPPKQIPSLRGADRAALPVVEGWPNSRLGKTAAAARTQRHVPASPPLWPKPRRGCTLVAEVLAEAEISAARKPLGDVRDRGREHPPELSRGGMRTPPPKQRERASSSRGSPPIGTPPRWRTDARRAALGIRRQLPWGSGPFGVSSSGKHCSGLPHRSHPLSGFLTPSAV
jgi:hypothetical protein